MNREKEGKSNLAKDKIEAVKSLLTGDVENLILQKMKI